MRWLRALVIGVSVSATLWSDHGMGVEPPVIPTVQIDQTAHFVSSDGEGVALPPGVYSVQAIGDKSIKVTEHERGAIQSLAAESGAHDEKLSSAIAVTAGHNEDGFHLALLLPDGRVLEAIGSLSGVSTRGSTLTPLGSPALSGIVGMQLLQGTMGLPSLPVKPQLSQTLRSQPELQKPLSPLPQTEPQLAPCLILPNQLVDIHLVATPTSPFSVELTWSGPPGDYQISGPVVATVSVNQSLAPPKSGAQTPRAGITDKSLLLQRVQPRAGDGRYEHKNRPFNPPVLPDFEYHYTVKATLLDGKKACGTAKAKTLPPPPIAGANGQYLTQNDIRLGFVLPPYVNAVTIYRDNLTNGWTPAPSQVVYQEALRSLSSVPVKWDPRQIAFPGLPPLPNDYTKPTSYDFTIEAVWFDGTGKPARMVRTPIRVLGPQPIWGFADTHAHQFANLGFGGLFVWGKVWDENGGGLAGALPWCDWWPEGWALPPGATAPSFPTLYKLGSPTRFIVHGAGGTNDIMGALVAGARWGHAVGGYDQFDGWPRWNSVSHQMMYYEWLKRAYDGGMRLMVMHAVNGKFLCNNLTRIFNCDDMDAVDRQLKAAHDLEAFVDQEQKRLCQSDSKQQCNGWYRIVRSPQDARAAIVRNEMAIVLGIEVPDLFGCASNPSLCGDADQNLSKHLISQLDKYTGPGYDVRHLFPIHSFDNAFGGTAFFQDIYRVAQRRVIQREVKVRPCSQEGVEYLFHTNAPKIWSSKAFSGGEIFKGFEEYLFPVCNEIGLLPLGARLIGELMKRHIIIDIDHMSHRAIDAVLQIAALRNYPVVSGHAGILETSVGPSKRHEAQQNGAHLKRIAELGGMGGVITAQGPVGHSDHDGVLAYSGPGTRVNNDCSNSSRTFAQAYLFAVNQYGGGNPNQAAVAFGTDMQGAIIQPGPRFDDFEHKYDEGCSGARDEYTQFQEKIRQENKVAYPFQQDKVAYPFQYPGIQQMPKLQAGSKAFDINTDGLSNVGMLPDFIADLRIIGLKDPDLQPLFQSAEGYIRMWERASYNSQPVAR